MDIRTYMYSLHMRAKVYVVAFILCTIYKTTSKIATALDKSLLFMYNLQPWLATITAVKYNPYYHDQFKKYLEDPSSTQVFDAEFKKHPLIPVLLALCIHIKFLSIECDTALFPGCNPCWNFRNDKEVNSGSKIGTLGPEVIQSFSDKYYKPLSGKDLRAGSVHQALPKLLEEVALFVELHQHKTPIMDMGQFMRSLVLVIIIESEVPNLRTLTRDELERMTDPLNSEKWSVLSITSILFPGIMQSLKKECQYRCAHPVPDRTFSNHSIIDKVYEEIGATTEPIDPTCLDYIFEGGVANASQGDAHAGADMDEAELNEGAGDIYGGEDVDENYDAMGYAPDDLEAPAEALAEAPVDVPVEMPAEAPAQSGNEPLTGPNQGSNPVRPTAGCPTSGGPISSPPNAERPAANRPAASHPISSPPNAGLPGATERPRAGIAPITESLAPKRDLPEAPTACKRSADEARIEPHLTSTPKKRNRVAALDDSGFEVIAVLNVERPDANTESEKENATKPQRSTNPGCQTSASGEGGATDVLRTTSQGPKQCVLCGASNGPSNQSRNAQEGHEIGARGSETTDATGDDNAGAIPRPVASKPDNEQKEGGEKAAAEAEIGRKARGYGKYAAFICIFAMLAVFVAYWVIYYRSPRINCDAGKEATAFCRSQLCIKEVNAYCFQKISTKELGFYSVFRSEHEAKEKDLIERFM